MSPVVRANWLLLTLALAMGFVIYMHGRQQSGSYTPITELDNNQVQQIIIQRQGEVIARFERRHQGWTDLATDKPINDQNRAARLLHIAQLPSLHHFPASGHELEAFGLQPPRYQLQLDSVEIRFGNIDPTTGLRYVQVGKQIHLISDGYTHYLSPGQAL